MCQYSSIAQDVAGSAKSGRTDSSWTVPGATALAMCLFGFLTTPSATSTPPEPVSPAYKLAAWTPRPTPTRPQATPTPAWTAPPQSTPTTALAASPTPTRALAPGVSPVPLPMPGTIRITLEIQADGQPWGVPVVYEIRTSDATKPLCEFLFDAPCISKITRVSR